MFLCNTGWFRINEWFFKNLKTAYNMDKHVKVELRERCLHAIFELTPLVRFLKHQSGGILFHEHKFITFSQSFP